MISISQFSDSVVIPHSDSIFLAKVGRVDNFIQALLKNGSDVYHGLYPASCTVYKYDNLLDSIIFSSRALRKAAGVKMQLEGFVKQNPLKDIAWLWTIHPGHPDALRMQYLSKHYKSRFISFERFEGLEESEALGADFQTGNLQFIRVADSMEESGNGCLSIEQSWRLFVLALQQGRIPVLDLSRLRPYGDTNSKGLKATGIFGDLDEYQTEKDNGSFLSIYWRLFNHLKKGDIQTLMQLFGQINRTINRGGLVKSGIICTGLHYKHPDIKAYLNTSLKGLIGSQKKGIRIDEGVLDDLELCDLICRKVNEESLFIEQIQPLDKDGKELFNNVCVEILLRHRATCLLSHINAGQITELTQIPYAMCEVTKFLCELHVTWRSAVQGWEKMYLPLDQDRQIGVGWVGFANMLSLMEISYVDHVNALEYVLDEIEDNSLDEYDKLPLSVLKNQFLSKGKAYQLAWYLYQGYQEAAEVAKEYGLERAFTMAPTQTVAFKYKDTKNKTLARDIDPPLHKRVARVSDRLETMWVSYGRTIETCIDVGAELHTRHWDQWQRLMDTTGMSHSMSFDLWQKIDYNWLKWFLTESYLKTTYYNFSDTLNQDYLDKGRLPDVVIGDRLKEKQDRILTDLAVSNCTPDFCPVCAE